MQPPRPNFDPRQHPPMQPGSQPPRWSSQGMNPQPPPAGPAGPRYQGGPPGAPQQYGAPPPNGLPPQGVPPLGEQAHGFQGPGGPGQPPSQKKHPIPGLSADQKHYRRPDGQVVAIKNPDATLAEPSFVCRCDVITHYYATNSGTWQLIWAGMLAPAVSLIVYAIVANLIISAVDLKSRLIGYGIVAAFVIGSFLIQAIEGHRWWCLLKRWVVTVCVLPGLIVFVLGSIFKGW